MKIKAFFFALGLLVVAGCSTTRYKPLCPPLVQYSQQEQKQAATELRTHRDLHELPIMMRDYGDQRRVISAGCLDAL